MRGGDIAAPTEAGESETIHVDSKSLRWLQQRQVVRKKCKACGLFHAELDAERIHELLRKWGRK